MSRGRPPRQATREALGIAEKFGVPMDISAAKSVLGDLAIFCRNITIFVKVKRTRSHISDRQEVVIKFRKEILTLLKIPQTGVVLRELWVRSPRGSWQYFRILDDNILEIRCSIPTVAEDQAGAGGEENPAGAGV
nr:hypothetical protein [uncultured Methanoregula sp.]